MRFPLALATLGLAAFPAFGEPGAPSFDCARAESDAERLVCDTPTLAELDVELARLFALAAKGPNIGDRLDELKATQRGWIKGRDDCWKADDLGTCVAAAYATRIFEIRQQYADARDDDAAGISTGPAAFDCPGLEAGLGAGFVRSSSPMAVLQWRENTLALPLVPAGSGAKYEGDTWLGRVTFWTRGDEAMLTLPDQGDMTCTLDDIG